MNWLQQLLAILGSLGAHGGYSGAPGQRSQPVHGRGGQRPDFGGGDPLRNAYMAQMNASYWNPGGGWLGANDMGQGLLGQYGFGGYYRGQPLPSYQGVNPNIGSTGWMAGAGYGSSPAPSPSWGAGNWLSQFMSDLNAQAQGGMTPYGPGSTAGLLGQVPGAVQGNTGLGALLSNTSGAEYHGGGPGMIEFLSRGGGQYGLSPGYGLSAAGGGGDRGRYAY